MSENGLSGLEKEILACLCEGTPHMVEQIVPVVWASDMYWTADESVLLKDREKIVRHALRAKENIDMLMRLGCGEGIRREGPMSTDKPHEVYSLTAAGQRWAAKVLR